MDTLRGKRMVGGTDNELAGWKEISKGICTVANWEKMMVMHLVALKVAMKVA
jgi:hypothetical protein